METLAGFVPLLGRGLATTLGLAILSLALATLLGAWGARAKVRAATGRIRAQFAGGLATLYTSLVRGVPDLVMILLIYFGGQRIINWLASLGGAEGADISKFGAGVFAIGFIYGAYLTETFRGAWGAIPRGQGEAAAALGLRGFTGFRLVMLPQFVRLALSGYGNVWQVLVKSTAVVSVIGLEDLVGIAVDVGKSQREPFVYIMVVLVVYFGITVVSEWLFARVERRANLGYQR
jgi:His/Glu/Gln/Arg/opine family amino acid ABC transporter permease subunit